jgi:hypothetical protein
VPKEYIKQLVEKYRHLILNMIALDLRALALFRIGLGGLLILDLVLRSQDLLSHYTDMGVLPLSLVPPTSLLGTWIAPHLMVSSPNLAGALFALTGMAAIGLIIGFKTRWMVAICWLLFHSLHIRNPFIIHAGDRVLILMLFWSFFLPLDRHYSKFSQTPGQTGAPNTLIASFATAGILLQLAIVYFVGALRKTGAMWQDGTAIWYVLQIDQYALPWTRAFIDYPGLLKGLTWTTLGIEFIAPLLLFAGPNRARIIGLALLAMLQVSFFLTLDLGLFPVISIVALLFAIPFPNMKSRERATSNIAAQPLDLRNRIAAYMAVILVLWSTFTLFKYPEELKESLPRSIRSGLELIRFDSYWSMFAPNPMTIDGWYVIAAKTETGEDVNLIASEAPLTWEKPHSVSKSFPSDRWKEFLMTLSDLGDPQQLWAETVKTFVRSYEATHAEKIVKESIRVVYMMERTTPIGESTPIQEQAWPKEDSF